MLSQEQRDKLLLELDDAALAENQAYMWLFRGERLSEVVDELDVAVKHLRKVQKEIRVALLAESFTHPNAVTVTKELAE